MRLSKEACYRAICARDAHYDGQFVRASKRLRVYCRPTCATPAPKPDNCIFFEDAPLADEHGYRPCRRCRPDLPSTAPRWAGTATTVNRALRLIASGGLNDKDVENLASRVGVTDRHLRRLFKQHLGCSPLSIAIARRLTLARQMTETTERPFINIAYDAGFNSVRRFNDAFRKAYGLKPTSIRSAPAVLRASIPSEVYKLRLTFRRPFDWPLVRQLLATRALASVEYVAGNVYQRAVEINDRVGVVTLQFLPSRPYVDVTVAQLDAVDLPSVVSSIREMLDLEADTAAIGRHFAKRSELQELIVKHPGVRVIGWWSNYECVVRTILAEYLGLQAQAALRAIVKIVSKPLCLRGPGIHVSAGFPSVEAIAESGGRLVSVGLPGVAVDPIVSIAASIAVGKLSLAPTRSPTKFYRDLLEIDGVSRRLAEEITRNVLERADALSAGDIRNLESITCTAADGSCRTALELSNEWRPWRAYAAAMFRQQAEAGGYLLVVPAVPTAPDVAPATIDITPGQCHATSTIPQ
jgi:AraC family transcriptional regulator of adaptative response / DNA-3-methyladenine glycosylase II